ncbi:MAG: AraC family transcriptional regulator [Cytophagaceae bacterium]|nr:AraC family transcriptional regulator [Cytophagaceae bacterium]MBK9511369.1 AraC family transcriptional regulator [Cytophagaceae bacterium]MBK9932689.1 AraC family transcriptional regulator [Cytophagaceae bacterium]MBL0303620.1 AraC family transcriptional regulator [Cytophagaceae bacterium]MBL0326449.1 AraC family transcriptional regulator [Cytophagaceae bacterium]
MLDLTAKHYENRKLENLVENRTIHTLKNAELNIFETHIQASQVMLKFQDPVLASMIKGKKVMHLHNTNSFGFLPGESVILPANELMCIDFPEATPTNPTQCLALALSETKLKEAVDILNQRGTKQNGQEWSILDYNYHFTNDIAINQILQRLIFIFTENHPSKDIFSDLLIQELVIRILQTETKSMYLKKSFTDSNNDRLSFVIKYIRENITEDLSIDILSEKAYMSESSFYRTFKHEIGATPNDFIIEERLKIAESMLRNPRVSIKEAYLASGFNSFSYFCRIFKKKKNLSPSEFKSLSNSMKNV